MLLADQIKLTCLLCAHNNISAWSRKEFRSNPLETFIHLLYNNCCTWGEGEREDDNLVISWATESVLSYLVIGFYCNVCNSMNKEFSLLCTSYTASVIIYALSLIAFLMLYN